MNTIIVSAFPGCGKTYLTQHHKLTDFCILEAETTNYKHNPQWETLFIDYVVGNIGKYDFILIPQHDAVLHELRKRKIPFVTVAPDNSPSLSVRERLLIKQQWFGRFLLRDNSHIDDIVTWFSKLQRNYDLWTSPAFFEQYGGIQHFTLNQEQYLSDILNEIHIS